MPCYFSGHDYDERREARLKARRAKLIAMGINPRGNKFMTLMMRP